MSDVGAMAVTSDMVTNGIENASSDQVPEGNTGGGTGMTMQGYKGGTGSSSRVVKGISDGKIIEWTIGALVQANFGARRDLTIGKVPLGRLVIEEERLSAESESGDSAEEKRKDGSIIIVIATDVSLPQSAAY